MRKVLVWGCAAIAAALVAAQFVPVARVNPPTDPSRSVRAYLRVPPGIEQILRRSCMDCHSDETRWPWYSRVAPVSWLIADDVAEGREHLNLSDWAQASRRGRRKSPETMLKDICEEVSGGKMPLSSYTVLHPDAKLSPEHVKALCDWANAERTRLAAAQHSDPQRP